MKNIILIIFLQLIITPLIATPVLSPKCPEKCTFLKDERTEEVGICRRFELCEKYEVTFPNSCRFIGIEKINYTIDCAESDISLNN